MVRMLWRDWHATGLVIGTGISRQAVAVAVAVAVAAVVAAVWGQTGSEVGQKEIS